MKKILLPLLGLALPTSIFAVEGGYSNYIPGTYGNFGMALAPAAELTLRNDVYYYGADVDRAVRSGRAEVGAENRLEGDHVYVSFAMDW